MSKIILLCVVLFAYEVVGYRSETLGSAGVKSEIRQNFSPVCEEQIADQVLMELEASYFYMHFANFFQQHDVALLGFHQMFRYSSNEERDHAQLLIDYVYKRGGKVELKAISAPEIASPINTSIAIIAAALEKEKEVNQKILELFNCSSIDPHFQDFLASTLISEQVESIHDLGILLSRLRRCAVAAHTLPMCEYEIDRELLEEFTKKNKA